GTSVAWHFAALRHVQPSSALPFSVLVGSPPAATRRRWARSIIETTFRLGASLRPTSPLPPPVAATSRRRLKPSYRRRRWWRRDWYSTCLPTCSRTRGEGHLRKSLWTSLQNLSGGDGGRFSRRNCRSTD